VHIGTFINAAIRERASPESRGLRRAIVTKPFPLNYVQGVSRVSRHFQTSSHLSPESAKALPGFNLLQPREC
jgi:hypothetical protein